MRRLVAYLAGLGLLAVPVAPVQAGYYSGRDLLAICTADKDSPEYFEKTYECAAYISGAVDAFNQVRENSKLKRCIPRNVTIKQLRDATVKYMRANYVAGGKSAASVVFAATRKAWPCGKRK